MRFLILLSTLNIFLLGCSTHKKSTRKEKSKLSAEQNFDQMIESVKKQGGASARFMVDDLYLKASHASIRGDVKTALFYWEKILKIRSNDSFINKKYAVDLIRSGKLVKAKNVLEKLDQEKGKDRDENLAMVLAGLYVSTGEKAKAKEVYKYLVEKKNNSEACVFLGRFYSEEKKYSKANKTLRDCEKKNPKRAIFSYFRAQIALEQKNEKLAKVYLTRALKKEPNFQEAAVGLGKIYVKEGKLKKAERIYKKFLKTNPDNFAVLSALVKVFYSQGAKPVIIPYVERLSNLDPNNLNLKVRLGILYSDSKKYDSAIGVFKEILRIVPSSEKILFYLASLYVQIDKPKEAIIYFSKIPASGALFKDSQVQVAKLYSKISVSESGKVDDKSALELVQFINERSKKYPKLEFDLKIVLVGHYENIKDYSAAVKEMETLQSNKQFKEEHGYYLASLLDKDNRFPEARVILEAMLEKNPNNPHALNFLGYSFVERGTEMDLAFKLIQRALALKPEDGYIRDTLGWYYYKVGKIKLALKEIKKAWQKEKSDVTITQHLAIIYQDLKRYRMAEKYFSEALKNCKQDSERLEVLQAMKNLEKKRLADTNSKRLPSSR